MVTVTGTSAELRSIYKAIVTAKNDSTLKAIDALALGRHTEAIVLIKHIQFYADVENTIVSEGKRTVSEECNVDTYVDNTLTNPVSGVLLNAKALGRQLGISGQEVNKRLTQAGLIYKRHRSSGAIVQALTATGYAYGTYGVGLINNTNFHTIKWSPSVLNIIKN